MTDEVNNAMLIKKQSEDATLTFKQISLLLKQSQKLLQRITRDHGQSYSQDLKDSLMQFTERSTVILNDINKRYELN